MGYLTTEKKKVTVKTFVEMKRDGNKIAMLTAYDYTTARLIDEAGVDSILVGDSASNVMLGNDSTLPITLDEMIVYARGVARGCQRALVVCDMPFGTYQVSPEEGVRNAVRLIRETGVDAVKLEGGEEVAPTIERIVNAGIPVVGHLGLTPQSIHKFGGYGVRARSEVEATKLIADAQALEKRGLLRRGAGEDTGLGGPAGDRSDQRADHRHWRWQPLRRPGLGLCRRHGSDTRFRTEVSPRVCRHGRGTAPRREGLLRGRQGRRVSQRK